ncbi:TetR/AcrR family transcriptional regulator [Streptomyces sp. B1866]|uniref:TetR/AcrR family transcriptional regulator n=1 Tax=Streptomyces sp. B1866 TaxID=3075431 RepID=UPI00288FC74B|nr:TetR/AcrR family transcriptional regulator [Streptomyces sp. B1866]MDT3398385.1 TetR/AcrR family transcriptional regulator [Streptomyces sp. B1866]
MPVKAGTAIDPGATRARVLASAAQLFYDRGVHSVGVDEIAQHAGASKLTIYRHFGSKEGLVEAVLRSRSERAHDILAARVAEEPPGPGRVLAIFDLLTRWFGEKGYRGCPVVNTAVETRAHSGAVREVPRAHLARYRELIEGLLTEAGVAAPAALARQVLLLIEGAIAVTAIDGDITAGRDARDAAETLLTAALGR